MIITKNYRDIDCGSLRISDVGKNIKLAGWIDTIRKLGGITFITLRDQYGITQLVADESMVAGLNKEDVISVSGKCWSVLAKTLICQLVILKYKWKVL